MAVIQVYSENIKIKYKSTILSKAAVLSVLSTIISILAPYLIGSYTEGFWIKENIFYEQPNIHVRGEYIIMITTDNLSHPIVCSTFAFHKEHMNHLDNCIFFRLREIDSNFDGKHDELDFSVRLNIFNLSVSSLAFVIPIKYELKTICPLKMQSLIIFQHNFHQKIVKELQVKGILTFSQSSALNCDGDYYSFYDTPLIEDGNDHKKFEFENFLEKYLERNLTTHLTNVYTYIKIENNNIFKLKLSIQYPKHKIYYCPGFWHKMKMAWTQYLALFIIVRWFLNKIESFMYRKKWLLFYIESPIKKK